MAGEYVGIPFAERGRGRAGCDCRGLARPIRGERFGLAVPGYTERYADTGDGAAIARAITDDGTGAPARREIPAGAEECGDGVVMTGIYRDGSIS